MNAPPIRLDERSWGRLATAAHNQGVKVPDLLGKIIHDYVEHLTHTSKRECVHGHDLTNPYNVRTRANGHRSCAECSRIRDRARYRKPAEPKPKPTHCTRGHSYAEHGRTTREGWRVCGECRRENLRAWRARHGNEKEG